MDTKRVKKIKRIPYIEVEGVENRYLDAALLLTVGEGTLDFMLRDEFKIIKKAGITSFDLKQHNYSQAELTRMVSPHLLENYSFYNYLARKWNEIQGSIIKKHLGESYFSLTDENWKEKIYQLVKGNEIPICIAINLFRFYNNGKLKDLIGPLLKTFSILFYHESGIQIEGINIDWDKVEEKFMENEPEEFGLSDVQLIGKNPEETLRLASQLISRVADELAQLEDSKELKVLYDREKEQNSELTAKLATALQENLTLNSKQEALIKDNKALSKKVVTFTTKVEQMKKESGKLGHSLGEIRKENDELKKENTFLGKKVATLQKEQNTVTEKVTKEIKREYELKLHLLKDKHEKEITLLEREITASKVQVEEKLYEKMRRELESLKNDMRVLEKERNELVEKITDVQKGTESDQNPFGFNEDDIEFFVEFDNKPTRN